MKNAILAGLAAVALAGCDIGGVRGNGRIVTEQRSVGPFVNVEAGGAFQIDWQTGAPSASVSADDNLMEYVELTVSDNRLHVRTAHSVRPTRTIKLTLTSSGLEGVRLSGASRMTAHQLRGPKFYLETTGASKVTVDGAVDELVASMTGASDLRADSLQTKTAALSVTGAGDARVAVSDTLKVSITGAGKVEYTGNPAHIEREVTGAGSIRKRD